MEIFHYGMTSAKGCAEFSQAARMQTHPPRPKPGDLIEIRDQLGVVSHLFGTRCYYWRAHLEAGNRVRVDRSDLLSTNTKLCLVVPRPGELAKRKAAEKKISLTKVAQCPKRDGVPGIKRISKKYGKNGRWQPWID